MADFQPIPFGPGLVLHRRLGAGGMAEVFRGVQTGVGGFQKVVAIKRMLPNLADSDDFEKMFQAEVNLTGRLQHPNIVQVFGNGEHEGFLYVVMEYVNGRDLAKILSVLGQRNEALPLEISVMIATEVARGLDYAHSFRDSETDQRECLVHRDISPQNVMVTFDGQVKIVDFGIAKVTDGVEAARTGVVRGKLAYMAPEQAAGADFDHRIDIFALGVVLHECLSGQRLFRGSNQADTLRRVLMCEVPPPSSRNPAVPPELDAIVLKALAREADERYSSAYELQRDLSRWLNTNAPGLVPREMGAFLMTLFADSIIAERESDRLVSSEYLPTTNTPVTGERPPPRTGSGAVLPAGLTGPGAGKLTTAPSSRSHSARLLVMPPQAESRGAGTAIAIGIAIALMGVVTWKLFASRDAAPKVPGVIRGLAGWFSADSLKLQPGEPIAVWKNQAESRGGDASQPEEAHRPTFVDSILNGLPVVKFDGAGKQWMQADTVSERLRGGDGLTVIFVARLLEDQSQFVLSVQQDDGNVDVARIGFATPLIIRVKAAEVQAREYLDSKPQPLFGWGIFSMVLTSEQLDLFFEGKPVGSTALTSAPAFAQARRVSLGQEFDVGNIASDFFSGQIAELALFARALETSERRSVEAYLGKKYGLTH